MEGKEILIASQMILVTKKNRDRNQGDDSRNGNVGGNGNDDFYNQPNNSNLVNVSKYLRVPPKKVEPPTKTIEGHGVIKWSGRYGLWEKLNN